MKKIIILIIILTVIIGAGIFLFNKNKSKDNASQESEQVEPEPKEDLKKDIKFDSNKMKTNLKLVYEEETANMGNSGLKISIKNGKAYLSNDINSKDYKFMFSEIYNESIKDKEITGFSSKVKDVYFAYMGNGDMPPFILFLMDDGSVEYINSRIMLIKKEFKSSGKIDELSNIVKFVTLNASDVDENGEKMSGFITVVAIDKEGYSYDLSASRTLEESYEQSYQ